MNKLYLFAALFVFLLGTKVVGFWIGLIIFIVLLLAEEKIKDWLS